jgi:hypothetical protein
VTAAAQPSAGPGFDWEAAGRAVSQNIDRFNAIAVLGSDDSETALVALGIARQQSRRRRVAVGDLLGNAAPFEALVQSDDPHGISDVFDYGLSLDRVARRVEGDGHLFILPTGVFITDHAEIMANRRWTKLAAGFREAGGLLILAANAATPDIEKLVVQLDGAVLVGAMAPAKLPVSRVLGIVREPPPPVRPSQQVDLVPARPSRYQIFAHRSLWRIGATMGIAVAAAIAALGLWLSSRPFAHSAWAPAWLRGTPVPAESLFANIRGFDTAGILDSTSNIATARGLGLLTAADSASKVPWGIGLISFNTQAGALLELQRMGATLRAGTFTPVLIRETPWFRVVAGAYPDSAAAAALLDTLQTRGTSDAGRAVIETYPYALLVERNVADDRVASRVAAYQTRGLPVYALLQTDGTARLFAGAFKTPEEATLLYEALKASGVQTSLVYRTGRVY